MRKFTFDTVDDCEAIFSHGDTVVFAGKHPWIFRKDGTYIAKLKSICRAYGMLFLPNNTVFMDGAGDKSYHYVSLDTGEVLWSVPKKGKRNLPPQKMALSPDEKTVYYLSCIGADFGNEHIDTIVPEERQCTTRRSTVCGGTICSFYVNEDGSLSILRRIVCSNDFQLFRLDSQTLEILSCQEFREVSCGNAVVTSNDEYILFDDWKVFCIKTREIFSLLENEPQKPKRNHFVADSYDPDRKLLTVHYLDHGSSVIVDCARRRIAAHYCPILGDWYGGCLIDDEFWIGSHDGISKRPFPHIEPFPRSFFEEM